jgi:hypothetical protein
MSRFLYCWGLSKVLVLGPGIQRNVVKHVPKHRLVAAVQRFLQVQALQGKKRQGLILGMVTEDSEQFRHRSLQGSILDEVPARDGPGLHLGHEAGFGRQQGRKSQFHQLLSLGHEAALPYQAVFTTCRRFGGSRSAAGQTNDHEHKY